LVWYLKAYFAEFSNFSRRGRWIRGCKWKSPVGAALLLFCLYCTVAVNRDWLDLLYLLAAKADFE